MRTFYPDKIFKQLANLQLAIILLFIIGLVIAIGTLIEQDQSLSFYQKNYPLSTPILGFLNWKFILFFNLDHIYTSYWFIFLLTFFGISLLSCTFTVQLPVLRKLRRWMFYSNVKKTKANTEILPINRANCTNYYLHNSNYNVFRQGTKIYAYSGLIGRIGPILVHISIILLLLGSTLGNFTGYIVQEFVPRGEVFHLQNFIKTGTLSSIPQKSLWRVNDFWITYTDNASTSQFYSDISVIDNFGNELERKVIFVNEPFTYDNITIYQTDWDISGIKFSLNNGKVQQIGLKKIVKSGQKIWLGIITSTNGSRSYSVLLNDLSGKIYIYDLNGNLIKECQLGEKITLPADQRICFSEILTNTGLQLKCDPGLKSVYFSFFFLIISTYASFISYSQIWGSENKKQFFVAGKSNRATLLFQSEFRNLIQKADKNF